MAQADDPCVQLFITVDRSGSFVLHFMSPSWHLKKVIGFALLCLLSNANVSALNDAKLVVASDGQVASVNQQNGHVRHAQTHLDSSSFNDAQLVIASDGGIASTDQRNALVRRATKYRQATPVSSMLPKSTMQKVVADGKGAEILPKMPSVRAMSPTHPTRAHKAQDEVGAEADTSFGFPRTNSTEEAIDDEEMDFGSDSDAFQLQSLFHRKTVSSMCPDWMCKLSCSAIEAKCGYPECAAGFAIAQPYLECAKDAAPFHHACAQRIAIAGCSICDAICRATFHFDPTIQAQVCPANFAVCIMQATSGSSSLAQNGSFESTALLSRREHDATDASVDLAAQGKCGA